LIGGDIHMLVSLDPEKETFAYPWRIPDKGNKYWVPLQDRNSDASLGHRERVPFTITGINDRIFDIRLCGRLVERE
jgi:hypothetical protein